MTPSTRSPIRRGLTAATAVAALLPTSVAVAQSAQADPCVRVDKRHSNCWASGGGGVSEGGGSRNRGDGGGWSGQIPGLTGDGRGGSRDGRGTPQPPQPTTAEWAAGAATDLVLPTPSIHSSPEGKTYVGITTKFWLEGVEGQATHEIKAPGQAVKAIATPVKVRWNFGEASVDCGSITRCDYKYKHSSTSQPGGKYTVSAVVEWAITWTCDGGGCDEHEGTLPNGESPAATRQLIVTEIQSNTRN